MGTTSVIHDIISSSLINTRIIAVTKGKEKGSQEKKKALNKGKNLFICDESFVPTCEDLS